MALIDTHTRPPGANPSAAVAAGVTSANSGIGPPSVIRVMSPSGSIVTIVVVQRLRGCLRERAPVAGRMERNRVGVDRHQHRPVGDGIGADEGLPGLVVQVDRSAAVGAAQQVEPGERRNIGRGGTPPNVLDAAGLGDDAPSRM